MQDLKDVLNGYPAALSNRSIFKAILMDLYPEQKRLNNILSLMLEDGSYNLIKNSNLLGDNDIYRIINRLEDEYGIDGKYSYEAINIWANTFDVVVKSNRSVADLKRSMPPTIVHAPRIENKVNYGNKGEYDYQILTNGTIKITKFKGFDESILTVPNRIDGYHVSIIGEAAYENCKEIEKIIVSEEIVQIEGGAFYGCSGLREIVLPQSLEILGNSTVEIGRMQKIANACKIERLDLPNSLKYIGNGAFAECTTLKEINFPENLQEIGAHAFDICIRLKKISLSNEIRILQKYAFDCCRNLEDVLLPDKLNYIGEYAFANTKIREIDIPISVTTIEQKAFWGCDYLSKVTLHEGLKEIGKASFAGCKQLKTILIPHSVISIADNAFGETENRQSEEFVVFCYAGTYGLEYARKHNLRVRNADTV